MRKTKEQLTEELDEAKRRITALEHLLERSRQGRGESEGRLGEVQRLEFLGRLAAEIAHDLNNMLYPIILDAEVLLEDLPRESTAHQILTQVLSAAHRQKDLVNQIFIFSRPGGRERVSLELKALVLKTLEGLRAELPDNIEIRKHLDVTDDKIRGDLQQIRQIITNLVRNAAESVGREPGVIEVSLSALRPEATQQGQVQLSVKDTGPYLSPDARAHVFDPSYTSGRSGRGTALGLAITLGMVEDHGGTITVESSEGSGSCFIVRFPAYQGGEVSGEKPGAPVAREEKGKKRILLVDDEDIILSSIQRVLRRLGYEVRAVNDSVEALEMFTSSPHDYDLVITDLTMPRMTGAELTSKLLALRPDIPVILSTGFSDVMDESKARRMGIREFLVKPAGIDELKGAISRSIGTQAP
jgi:nitrogen-specific signal transduction histidine kinase/CheY-like chemotaxis protein